MKDIKIFLKKKKKKSDNMVVNATKISQKMKKINWLSTEKNIIEWERFAIIIRKSMRNFFLLLLFLERNVRDFFFSDVASSFLNIKRFFKFRARKFYFLKYKKLFKCGFFLLFKLGKSVNEMKEIFLRLPFPET